jgi:hypothetical protein
MDPTIPVNQSIYETSTTQKTRLGARLAVGDRVYRYAVLGASANVTAGDVLCATQPTASHQSGLATVAAATTGASTLTLTLGVAAVVNAYADGYVSIASAALAGGGTIYKIKSNAVCSSAGAAAFVLYDPIPGSIGAGPISLLPSEYKNVFVGSAALDIPVGVAPVAVTTGEYFWLQTWGPASAKHEGNTPAAAGLTLGTLGGVVAFSLGETLGATGYALTGNKILIGKNIHLAATATQCNPVYLMVTP